MTKTLQISIKDYFSKDIIKLILFPLFGSLIVLYFLFFSFASGELDNLEQTTIKIQTHQTMVENGQIVEESTNQTYTGSGILDFLLSYSITSSIVSFFVYTLGLFAIGYLSIFISLIIIGFLSPRILSIIHKKHYPNLQLEEGFDTTFTGISKLIKTFLMMCLLIIILTPLYFIPFINIIAINLPFYYFFHKMLNYDVGANLMGIERFKRVYYINKSSLRARTLLLYIISLIPFIAFFIATFYIIFIGHSYYDMLEKDINTN